jgi:hypothetical protein
MNTSRILRVTALTIAMAVPLHATATGKDVFRNGESLYGQLAAAGAVSSRVVDLGTTKHLTVPYGETVTFQAPNGKQFTWTFNGLDRRSVPISKIAPSDIAAPAGNVYVRPNPLSRR